MRTPVIAGNWKMFKTTADALDLITTLKPLVKDLPGIEIVVAPVFTVLAKVNDALAGSNIKLSAQDCFWEKEGAFTGEISVQMLRDAGCTHVIIGHSERRQYFGETDETVNRKIGAAVAEGLVALFCIGETLEERETDRTFTVLARQVKEGLKGITAGQLQNIVVAYEPVWAIGTGKTATDDQAQEVHAFIRNLLNELFGETVAQSTRILYGGSVKPENVKGLMSKPDIDGALVGGASLKADSFAAIASYNK